MRSLGAALGRAMPAIRDTPVVVTIKGELGAGKTTLVSGVLHALGIDGPIRSPTYTLIEPYETPQLQVYHMDLYRLADAGEIEPLGIRDLLTPAAVLLIEWPERAAAALPPADITLSIQYGSLEHGGAEARRLIALPMSAAGQHLVQALFGVQA